MDIESSRCDNQESTSDSHGQCSEPEIMPLQHLKEITNNFSDERILGQGGFGVVYKGVLQNGEMVAVKKLLQPMPNSLKQFKNEVDLLVRLKHPNIVRLIGYCYETQNVHMDYNGQFIFAEMTHNLLCLEYLPNGSLDTYISDESHGLDWHTRYTIIEGICSGLQYLHEQIKPIIHLDLKPANILLTDNMVPKVTDFGLSRLLDQQQTMYTLITNGTRGYMPPEYIQGGTITPMSDIFSLGVIILEVITGHRDYPDVTRTSSEDFIKLTLKKWSDVLEKAPGYTSLEIDCQQIRSCIQIGLLCVNPERTKRPTAAKVIKMLQGLESMDCHGGSDVTSSASESRPAPRELLDICPLELCFSLEPDKLKPCLVKLTNKTDGYVTFRFKATRATNKYRIEPASGFLWPRSLLNVVVTMEERCELPPDLQRHDEFLVQSITVRGERVTSEHITEDTFNNVSSNAVQKVKLTVAYEPFTQPPPLPRVLSDSEETETAYVPDGTAAGGGLLCVIVHEAQDLEGKHHTNPYANIVCQGEKKKTKVIRRNRDPRWEETFEFVCEEPPTNDALHVEVLSKAEKRGILYGKECLGYIDISLADVISNRQINEKYRLMDSKNGQIRIELQWRTP